MVVGVRTASKRCRYWQIEELIFDLFVLNSWYLNIRMPILVVLLIIICWIEFTHNQTSWTLYSCWEHLHFNFCCLHTRCRTIQDVLGTKEEYTTKTGNKHWAKVLMADMRSNLDIHLRGPHLFCIDDCRNTSTTHWMGHPAGWQETMGVGDECPRTT